MTRPHKIPCPEPILCSQEAAITALQGCHTDMAAKIERITHTIHGNGDGIGMKTDLALVVQRTEGLKESMADIIKMYDKKVENKNNKTMLWLTGIAVATSIFLGMAGLLRDNKVDNELKKEQAVQNKVIDVERFPDRSVPFNTPVDSLRSDKLRK